MQPFLVDWWDQRLHYEREARDIEHQRRLLSPELLAMYNKPQAVINLQQLHDDVLWHVGAYRHALIGPPREEAPALSSAA